MQATEVPEDYLRDLLVQTATIGMIGAGSRASQPSNGVIRYPQAAGNRVIPVNPVLAGERLLGEIADASLAAIPSRVERVAVFRRPEAVAGTVAEIIPLRECRGIRWLRLQLGVVDESAAERARAAGIDVVMDRCLKIEHGRLARIAGDISTVHIVAMETGPTGKQSGQSGQTTRIVGTDTATIRISSGSPMRQ